MLLRWNASGSVHSLGPVPAGRATEYGSSDDARSRCETVACSNITSVQLTQRGWCCNSMPRKKDIGPPGPSPQLAPCRPCAHTSPLRARPQDSPRDSGSATNLKPGANTSRPVSGPPMADVEYAGFHRLRARWRTAVGLVVQAIRDQHPQGHGLELRCRRSFRRVAALRAARAQPTPCGIWRGSGSRPCVEIGTRVCR